MLQFTATVGKRIQVQGFCVLDDATFDRQGKHESRSQSHYIDGPLQWGNAFHTSGITHAAEQDA